MKLSKPDLKSEEGSALLIVVMIVSLLAIIGMAALNSSTMEQYSSMNLVRFEQAFYTAEAGIEKAKVNLLERYTFNNNLNGSSNTWSFALDGGEKGNSNVATEQSFAGGVTWINSDTITAGHTYSAIIWNNDDGGNAMIDQDGLIFLRSVAKGPRGNTSGIEILLQGTSVGISKSGYKSQAGAGSGKSYTGEDQNAMGTFSQAGTF